MGPELLWIQPSELKFTFEAKKQSTCSIQLINNTDHYVAFKVKTTSPKKYCVRPNTGVILPKSTCEFTVTMQAQREVPADLQCKDKFLIQSTIVPVGSTEEEITPNLFAKESGGYIQENKLKVVLVSPPHSPVLLPINGVLKQEAAYEASILNGAMKHKPANNSILKGALKQEPAYEASNLKGFLKQEADNEASNVIGTLKQEADYEASNVVGVLKQEPASEAPNLKGALKKEPAYEASILQEHIATGMENLPPYLVDKDAEEMRSNIAKMETKLNELELKLNQAEKTITRLREENVATIQERDAIKQELTMVKRKGSVKVRVVGFPFLFVCFVALVSMYLGHLIHV